MARLDALRLARELKQRMLDYTLTDAYLRDGDLREMAAAMWQGPPEAGGLVSNLWVEASWPAEESGETLHTLTLAGSFPEDLTAHLDRVKAVPRHRPLYSHQAEALAVTENERPAVVITAGTGAGKTEAFLLPLLRELWGSPASGTGVRALILYPMNALVNDQVDRLYQWLAGQKKLRFTHFTSETPEDRKAADRQGAGVWDEARCRTRKQARGMEDAQGNALPPDTRQPVPDILVTNYSMLEYMLARPQDRVFFGSNLQALVLDEAHLYTGTLAAEITLLLRRLLDRCERTPDQVLQLATSATIGTGDPEELRQFARILFDKQSVRLVEGREEAPDYPEARPPAEATRAHDLLDLPEFETLRLVREQDTLVEEMICDPAQARSLFPRFEKFCSPALVAGLDPKAPLAVQLKTVLAAAPLVQRLDVLLRQRRFQTVRQLSERLFPDEEPPTARAATIRLLALGAAARQDLTALPLLPHRLHLIVRASEGLSCCINPGCTGPAGRRWGPVGALQDGFHDTCAFCESLALTVARCSNCGEGALAADSKAGSYFPFQPPPWDERAPHVLLTFPGRQGTVLKLDPARRTRCGAAQPGVELVTLEECPNCQGKRTGFRTLASRGNVWQSIVAETILASVPPLVGRNAASHDILPARGRRLLAFSDSRAEAARLGPRLRRQHELQIARTALVEILRDTPGPDPMLIELLKTQMRTHETMLAKALSKDVARHLERELQKTRTQLSALQEGGALEEWVERFSEHPLLHELLDVKGGRSHEFQKWDQWTWVNNYERVQGESLLRLGLELGIPDRKIPSTLESIGWAEVTYPGLSAFEPPAALVGQMPAAVRRPLAQVWPDLVAALLDTVRLEHCVTLGSRELDLEWQQGSFPYGRWMPAPQFVGQREYQRRREFVRDVLIQAGLSHDLAAGWAEPVLQEVFGQLFSGARLRDRQADTLPWLEGWDGYQVDEVPTRALRVRFPGLGLRRPAGLFRCSCTGRVWPRSVQGCAPEPGSRGTLIRTSAEELDQTPPVSRARREYAQSPVFRIGLWAEEHSAQLSPREGRRLQQLFRAGMRNLLSATTTMELGIDIGGLSAAFLSNVPPGKANYLQRAGRVGRRADGSSVVVTGARSRPYDREVFRRIGDFLARPLRRPRVFLERQRVVQRHFQAWLMGSFFAQLYRPTDHVGAMDAFGRMGTFCGRVRPPRWERGGPRPELPAPPPVLDPTFVRPAWWDSAPERPEEGLAHQFAVFVQSIGASREGVSAARLGRLFHHTVLELDENWDALFEQARELFQGAVDRWRRDYDPLLAQWQATREAGQANALRYQMKALHQTTVIEALADAQFLPRYGFPIGLLRLRVVTRQDGKVREEDQFRLERPGLLALGEYVPGSQLLAGGRLITSRGLLKHWTGENLDEAFGTTGRVTRCAEGHEYYWITEELTECPVCQSPERESVSPLLFPRHGFTTADWDPPRYSTDVERVGSVSLSSLTFSQHSEQDRRDDFAGVPGLVARYQEAGEILVTNRGDHRCGFAVCTRCGYADSEKKYGRDRMELPTGFPEHLPLFRSEGAPCWGKTEAPVLRNQVLAAHQTTDVLLLDFAQVLGRKASSPELVLTLGLALQLSGARLLELDSRELGVLVVPTASDRLGPVLFDNVPGGAGHVLELMKTGPEWLKAARDLLWVDSEHDRHCRSACLDCLMSIDAQARMMEFQPRRKQALEELEKMMGAPVR